VWVLAAGGLGWVATAVLAGWLHLPRSILLAPYTAISGIFLYAYFRWSRISLKRHLLHHWPWGLLGAVISGGMVVANVLSQPASPAPQGVAVVGAIVWLGLVYGIVDALLLSVMPVMAIWQALSLHGWTRSWPGRIAAGAVALAASLAVTAAYHLGYPEFRGPAVRGPVIGNGLLTLAYLLTGNPLASIGGHVAMHIAAVLHGPESAIQLPPHY
jgi:hypothetical protein